MPHQSSDIKVFSCNCTMQQDVMIENKIIAFHCINKCTNTVLCDWWKYNLCNWRRDSSLSILSH